MYVLILLLGFIWLCSSICKNVLLSIKLYRDMNKEDNENFKKMLKE